MDFNQIQLEVGKILLKKITLMRMPHLSVEDAISDAYLELLESGNEITKESVLRLASRCIDNQRSAGHTRKAEFSKATQRTCPKCNESKPTACFGIWHDKKNNCQKVQTYCKECHYLKYKEWVKKNPEKIKEHCRIRYKKDKLSPAKYENRKASVRKSHRKKAKFRVEGNKFFGLSKHTLYTLSKDPAKKDEYEFRLKKLAALLNK